MTTFGFYPPGDTPPVFSTEKRVLHPENWTIDQLIDRLELAENDHFNTECPALLNLSLEAIRHRSDTIFLDINLVVYRLHEHLRTQFMGHSLLLFPYLKWLATAKTGARCSSHLTSFSGRLRMLTEPDIEKTGSLLQSLREKIDGLTAVPDMTETGRRLLHKLTSFASDLQTLIFLEKEMLLPKAEALELEYCDGGVAAYQNRWFG